MMKKILSALILISFLAVLVVPMVVSAQDPGEVVPAEITKCKMRHNLTGSDWTGRGFICAPSGSDCVFSAADKTCAICCLMDTIYTVTDWIFVGVVALVIIFVLMGAFNILTAGGSPEKVKTGRDYIIWAMAGMLVALLAKAIPWVVRNIMGM